MIAVIGSSGTEVTIEGNMYGIHEKDELVIEGEWVNG